MKNKTLFILTMGCAILFSSMRKDTTPLTTGNSHAVATVPLYRLLDPYGYHFYTTDEAEKNSVIRDLGFVYEDIIGYVFPQQVSGTIPLYRYRSVLYYYADYGSDKFTVTARHFYTTNQNDEELKSKTDQTNGDKHIVYASYVSEGIQGYISGNQVAGTTPIYQLKQGNFIDQDGDKVKSHPGGFDWFYTNNEAEKFSAVNKYGYVEKGIVGYMWTSATIK